MKDKFEFYMDRICWRQYWLSKYSQIIDQPVKTDIVYKYNIDNLF